MGDDLKDLLKHSRRTLIKFVAVLVFAILFYGLEKLCEKMKLPKDLVFGTHWVSIALFALDGMVVIGGALSWAIPNFVIPLIQAWKRIKRSWTNDE